MKPKVRSNRKGEVKSRCSEESRTDMRIWLCRCPRCGVAHSVEMFWTGRGNPRKFCDECRNSEDYLYYIEPYRLSTIRR